MGLAGILVGLALLIWLAFRGWSVLLLAPAAALVAAAFAGEPLLANWTQTFMGGAAVFLAQFFPIFLLGALFGKLMEDSGSVAAIATFMMQRLGQHRAVLAVVLAGALVTYGGVSLFVALFVLAPMAQGLFRAASVPRRLMQASARHNGEGFGADMPVSAVAAAGDLMVRERATTAREFDPAEIRQGVRSAVFPSISRAATPLIVVVLVNLLMSLVILPRLDTSFLAEEKWGSTSISGVGGVWAVVTALLAASVTLIVLSRKNLTALRATMDAGANASVLPALSVASLVGFGAVVAALPAFELVRDWVLSIAGGPLVSLAVATNVLAALTGSASGGLTIALDALGHTYTQLAGATGIDPALMHRVAVISAGTLDSLPHNGAVVTLLAVCGSTHRESYFDIVMVAIVGAVIALVAVIALGSAFGSF